MGGPLCLSASVAPSLFDSFVRIRTHSCHSCSASTVCQTVRSPRNLPRTGEPGIIAAVTFHWATVYLASEWLVRLVMLLYVPQNRTPAAARTWLLMIFLLPWPGLAIYLLLGRATLPARRRQMQERASRMIRTAQNQFDRQRFTAHPELPENLTAAAKLAYALGDFEPFGGNAVELIAGYQSAIDRLVADVDAAAGHVHLLYYIWENDAIGGRLADAAERAARRGVKVRVLIDAVAGKGGLRKLAPRMRSAGVEVDAVLKVNPLFMLPGAARFDLRNHRKIAVVDGRVGYTGSQNIVDPEFVPGKPNEELVVRLAGPIVSQLQAVFLADRYFETGKAIDEPELFPDHAPEDVAKAASARGADSVLPAGLDDRGSAVDSGEPRVTHDVIAQLLPSGPGYLNENGQEVVVALIHGARSRVVVTTPYLIPDEPVLQALRSAVHRGVDARLIVSRYSNQLVAELAQQSFYAELLSAGVVIHRYEPGFLHAKHVSVDDDVAIIGTANLDIRSFKLNAEVVAILYDRRVVSRLREVQERYIAHSETLTAEAWEKRPTLRRLGQNVARMADALL